MPATTADLDGHFEKVMVSRSCDQTRKHPTEPKNSSEEQISLYAHFPTGLLLAPSVTDNFPKTVKFL
jgi:hypothetical protein